MVYISLCCRSECRVDCFLWRSLFNFMRSWLVMLWLPHMSRSPYVFSFLKLLMVNFCLLGLFDYDFMFCVSVISVFRLVRLWFYVYDYLYVFVSFVQLFISIWLMPRFNLYVIYLLSIWSDMPGLAIVVMISVGAQKGVILFWLAGVSQEWCVGAQKGVMSCGYIIICLVPKRAWLCGLLAPFLVWMRCDVVFRRFVNDFPLRANLRPWLMVIGL